MIYGIVIDFYNDIDVISFNTLEEAISFGRGFEVGTELSNDDSCFFLENELEDMADLLDDDERIEIKKEILKLKRKKENINV